MCTSYGPTAARTVSGLYTGLHALRRSRSDSVTNPLARDGRHAMVGVLHDAVRFRHARV